MKTKLLILTLIVVLFTPTWAAFGQGLQSSREAEPEETSFSWIPVSFADANPDQERLKPDPSGRDRFQVVEGTEEAGVDNDKFFSPYESGTKSAAYAGLTPKQVKDVKIYGSIPLLSQKFYNELGRGKREQIKFHNGETWVLVDANDIPRYLRDCYWPELDSRGKIKYKEEDGKKTIQWVNQPNRVKPVVPLTPPLPPPPPPQGPPPCQTRTPEVRNKVDKGNGDWEITFWDGCTETKVSVHVDAKEICPPNTWFIRDEIGAEDAKSNKAVNEDIVLFTGKMGKKFKIAQRINQSTVALLREAVATKSSAQAADDFIKNFLSREANFVHIRQSCDLLKWRIIVLVQDGRHWHWLEFGIGFVAGVAVCMLIDHIIGDNNPEKITIPGRVPFPTALGMAVSMATGSRMTDAINRLKNN